MPAEAMSGDESDHAGGRVRYVVRAPNWRNPAISSWMTTFDNLHLSTRFNGDGRATPGKFPRLRIRSTKRGVAKCAEVPGLPKNFYDEKWLNSLHEEDRNDLEMQPALDLSFTPYIQRFVVSRLSAFSVLDANL